MVKSTLTFDSYDQLVERINDNSYKCENWWPTVEEIKEHIEPQINKNIEFLLWIMETADDPQTEEEKKSKKYINQLLINTLKLID